MTFSLLRKAWNALRPEFFQTVGLQAAGLRDAKTGQMSVLLTYRFQEGDKGTRRIQSQSTSEGYKPENHPFYRQACIPWLERRIDIDFEREGPVAKLKPADKAPKRQVSL